jgi:monoamine oxidase
MSTPHVVIAGAGLAGLVAARELEARGVKVTVIDARDRIGGRVHTLRDLGDGIHAEAGADLIEAEQTLVLELARELRLRPERILRTGFGFYGPDRSGRRRTWAKPKVLEEAARLLHREIEDYCAAGKQWDSAVAAGLARESVAHWLERVHSDITLAAGMRGLRGFFLADPEDLSLIALVDQFASGGEPGEGAIFRLGGGNDRLPAAIAHALAEPPTLNTILRAVQQDGDGVRLTVEHARVQAELSADYLVSTLPASTLKDVRFTPALPDEQARAIATLRYGCATRVVLRFARPHWRTPARPRAFGTDLPTGAVWDGAEGQGRAAVLTLLAGGRASAVLRELVISGGAGAVVDQLAWLGEPSPVLAIRSLSWEDEPWSRGGYAYFDPTFDPRLRAWLARPAGRIVFAGEHTSLRWQGFMNGAIESGRRAAAEISYLPAAS